VPDAVLTREPAAAAAYAAVLAPLGLGVVAMPVTRTEAAADEDRAKLAAAVAHLSRFDAVLVASPRAAEALVAAMGGDVTGLWGAGAPKVWAIGAATQAALARANITAAVPGKSDAAGLAEAVIAGGMARRILLPRAEGGRDEGIAALEAAGATVEAITAYRTVAVPADDESIAVGVNALAGEPPAALVALFAPSQVTALDAILAARGTSLAGLGALGVPIVAIGGTTGAAITAAGATIAAVAESPTPEGMAKAAAAVYPGSP
jgi:uroporphyrinogen-III synthase